jgi:hypothetical protein
MRKSKNRRRIIQRLKELAVLAKQVCPEANVTIDANGADEVDGWLIAVVPDGTEEKVRNALRPVRESIYDQDGFWINLSIYERSEVKEFELAGKERG